MVPLCVMRILILRINCQYQQIDNDLFFEITKERYRAIHLEKWLVGLRFSARTLLLNMTCVIFLCHKTGGVK